MNMAVYVIPFLNYSRNEDCEKLSRRIVEVWNEKKVTSLTLSHSSYDDIAEGFRSKLCYITTAVCEHMQKEDDCYEMQVMRRFRDEYLMQTDEGRSIIKDYYEVAPGIVMILKYAERMQLPSISNCIVNYFATMRATDRAREESTVPGIIYADGTES